MGRRPRDRRQVFNAICWRARTGSPWRDVPERYGPRETAYSLFRRWQIDGTWTRLLKELQVTADAEGFIEWEVSVDSTVVRAHQHAAGARRRGLVVRAGRIPAAWRPNRTATRSAARAAV
jgi:transposase